MGSDLLRGTGALRVGPALADALALDRLAGRDAQPLLRVVAAFVPAGLLLALALREVAPAGRTGRAALAGLPAYAVLIAIGAASDAVTRSEPLSRHVAAQPGRAAAWLPALVFALCAYLVPDRARGPLHPHRPARRRMPPANGTPTAAQDTG